MYYLVVILSLLSVALSDDFPNVYIKPWDQLLYNESVITLSAFPDTPIIPQISYCEAEKVRTLLLALPSKFHSQCQFANKSATILPMYEIMIREALKYNVSVELFPGTLLTNWSSCEVWLQANFGSNYSQHIRIDKQIQVESPWIRDFGPFFYRNEEGDLGVVDSKYLNVRPFDDYFPTGYSVLKNLPVDNLPLALEGGNVLANGNGICLVADYVLKANKPLTDGEIRKLFAEQLGCTELVLLETLQDCATGHVDMYLSWINSTHLLVGEYSELADNNTRITIEKNVNLLKDLVDPGTGEKIHITRVPMPSNCPKNKLCKDQSIYPCCPFNDDQYVDCSGTCFHSYEFSKPSIDWLNDGVCNDGHGAFYINFTCPEWYYDGKDCGMNMVPPSVGGYDSGICPNVTKCRRIWRTYLNVLQMNDIVFFPTYLQDNTHEQAARGIWESFNYKVVDVPSDYIIPLAGTVHCITKTIPVPRGNLTEVITTGDTSSTGISTTGTSTTTSTGTTGTKDTDATPTTSYTHTTEDHLESNGLKITTSSLLLFSILFALLVNSV